MSYFILPKTNNILIVNPIDDNNYNDTPYISKSLFYYSNEIIEQINIYFDTYNNDSLNADNSSKLSNINKNDDVIKFINPYEFIFSKVSFSKFSISKLNPKTNLFYEFLEITTALNIFDLYKSNKINTLHITKNNCDIIECFEMIRENYKDEIKHYDEINDETIKLIGDEKFVFLFFDSNFKNGFNEYILSLIKILIIILKNQQLNGSCIIKINQTFSKQSVQFLYILSSIYDKTYIFKPNTCNVTLYDKYIICKNFRTNENKEKIYEINYFKLLFFLKNLKKNQIVSIFDCNIPYYFLTKVDDINMIIGQQQVESLDMIINLIKSKNKDDKIELIKKNGIQKSIAWCEKYKIPCNKFSEKTNIFLSIN